MKDATTHRDDDVPPRGGDTLLVTGNGHVWTFALDRLEMTVGRDAACAIVIADRALSRQQFVVRAGPPVTIEDLGSTNGTRVRGESRRGGAPVEVAVGESFHVGPFTFMVIGGTRPESTAQRSGELLVVDDPTVTAASATITEVALSSLSVLVLGESGAGKEVLAETLHVLSRRSGPLQRINCAALSEQLLEAELFGHEKGAFTGAVAARPGLLEAAQGGTVFLDEIGELSLSTQAKLLRAIEAREVVRLGASRPTVIDVRFVSATHRDLPQDVADKRFRHDLFFRIDGVTLHIPPLRERRGMIPRLAAQFAARAGVSGGLSTDVLAALEAYDWPGNVRELKAVVERAAVLARGSTITRRHLAFSPRREPGDPAREPAPVAVVTSATPPAGPSPGIEGLDPEQAEERARIVQALEDCMQNQTRAAARLGMSRTAFVTKLRVYRIPRPRS